jgi:rod shape-determining protein MreD
MATLIAIPLLGGLMMIQSAIASRLTVLHGSVDLLLLAILAWSLQKRVETGLQWGLIGGLLMTIFSDLPLGVALAAYVGVASLGTLLRQRNWQAPVLGMLIAVFAGTLIVHGLSYLALRFVGNSIPLLSALNLITLPSLLINLLVAIPAYALMGDLAEWLYPEELEV